MDDAELVNIAENAVEDLIPHEIVLRYAWADMVEAGRGGSEYEHLFKAVYHIRRALDHLRVVTYEFSEVREKLDEVPKKMQPELQATASE